MDAFEAIAEPNRRRILDLLKDGERPAGDVVEALSISQPGVSKHLKLLREAGLVRVRADGQRRLYSLAPRRLAEIETWLRPTSTSGAAASTPWKIIWRGNNDAGHRRQRRHPQDAGWLPDRLRAAAEQADREGLGGA